MALVGPKTLCPVCRLPLAGTDAIGFPPFVTNRADRLAVFNDAAVHRTCFEAHPLAARATEMLARYSQAVAFPRRCAVCGGIETSGEDWFSTGLIQSEPDGPGFDVNFVSMHRAHFERWSERARFRTRLEAVLESAAWNGPRVEFEGGPRWVPDLGAPVRSKVIATSADYAKRGSGR